MFLKKLINKSVNYKTLFAVAILVLLGIYTGKASFTKPFFVSHDGDSHIARSLEAIEALSEGHFPLRWAGRLNGLCGAPIFNFFYPLFYYLVALINQVTNNVLLSLEIIFFATFIIAPIFFFLWLLKETSNCLAAFVGALFYLFVPYRFLLVYVRSSPEFLAYTILPIFLYQLSILFSLLKKKKTSLKSKRILFQGFFTSTIGGLLIISHNLVVLVVAPILLVWLFIKVYQEKTYKNRAAMGFLVIIGVSALAISAFFWGPMILEQKYTKLAIANVFPYYQHFPTVRQLIRSPWGRWYSVPGTKDDGMSFMVGYAQWLVIFIATWFFCFRVLKKKFENLLPVLFWYFATGIYLFLMWERSIPIWELIEPIQRIQFPWRLLGVTGFTIAAMTGFLIKSLKLNKLKWFLVIVIFFLAIYGNRNHLGVVRVDDPLLYQDFHNKHHLRYHSTTVGNDIISPQAEEACDFYQPFLKIDGQIFPNKPERGNTFGLVYFDWPKEESADVDLKLAYFPDIYRIDLNGKEVGKNKILNNQGQLKLSSLSLKEGENKISWQIVQSSKQKFFNYFSLAFFTAWSGLLVIKHVPIKKKK